MTLPYILMIAPHAPPKNTAEAIQVGRLLAALSGKATGHVVSAAAAGGWATNDASLAPLPSGFTAHALRLPLHEAASRILGSRHLTFLHHPDSLFWLKHCTDALLRQLPQQPDMIYSRSGPLSGTLLAQQLKQRLNRPWIMHLSDPWADSPKGSASAADIRQESACFAHADVISLTTEGQANFYRDKYTQHAAKFIVARNMMPEIPETTATKRLDEYAPLRIVFAGNLYGSRSPESLLSALARLRSSAPELLQHLRIEIYGHAQAAALAALTTVPDTITYHGAVSYTVAQQAQSAADIILSIELLQAHPLAACFMPSKILEAMALGKPLLALTPAASETASLCREGYGWAVEPNAPDAIAALLATLIRDRITLRHAPAKAPPLRYHAGTVANEFLMQVAHLTARLHA